MVRRFASLLAATTLGLVALTSAPAVAGAPEQAAGDALIPFQAEIMLLVELGAFSDALPPVVRQVHDDWKSYAAGMDRAELMSWLSDVDVQGSGLMINLAAPIEPAIVDTLSMLSAQDMAALDSGNTISLDAMVYGRAWTLLDDRSWGNTGSGSTATTVGTPPPGATIAPSGPTATSAPSVNEPSSPSAAAPDTGIASNPGSTDRVITGAPRVGFGLPANATASATSTPVPGAPTASTVTPTATTIDGTGNNTSAGAEQQDSALSGGSKTTSSNSSGSSSVAVIALAAGALLIAIGVGVAMMRRRGRTAAGTTPATNSIDTARRFDDVLAAGRRLSRQMEPAALDRAICDEARTILDGSMAVLVKTSSGRPVVSATSAIDTPDDTATSVDTATIDTAAVDPGAIDRSAISRTIDTAQATRTVGTEPLVGGRTAATLTVPIASAGTVIAALAVIRDESRPFDSEDQDLLARLASLAGVALEGASRHDQLTEMTFTDALTTLANRRRLDRDLQNLLSTPVAFVMVDIDHFKHFNDTNGHPAGDELLRQVSKVLAENVRPNDVVYRYGGEEFSVLLPDSTADDARQIAERLCSAVATTEFVGGSTQPGGRLTISVGVATTNLPDAVTLKQQADRALYDAKQSGRNRVVIAPTN
ncbi:MAG: diguanylate cyclase [Acidimicrobiia bacterium]